MSERGGASFRVAGAGRVLPRVRGGAPGHHGRTMKGHEKQYLHDIAHGPAQGVCFLGYGAAHLAIMAGRAAGMLAPVYWGDEVRARARACVRVWLRKRVKDGYGEGEKERGRAGEG